MKTLFLLCLSLTGFAQHHSGDTITVTGVFDRKMVTIGNFEKENVYKLNNYCVSASELTQGLADSLHGKKVRVKGALKIMEGQLMPTKSSNNGKIYEPYKEPDKLFIAKPVFTIVDR